MHCSTQVIRDVQAELSDDMINLIGRLPRWSHGAQPKYTQFFANYGTHAITQLALGGTVRVLSYPTTDGRQNFMVFRDGGASTTAELTVHLEHNFPPSRESSKWKAIYGNWIQALEKDPVFCPDHEYTIYTPIYRLHGLSSELQADLKSGYLSYREMASRAQNDKNSDRKVSRPGEASLPRAVNLAQAVELLLGTVTQSLIRFRQGR
ncbi:hypothetical protein C8R45DRAFT_1014841 [Mycena sanguinolenta]|nr:hypothetical protein C8R45DRAFT_1014841 [Mycena sanguinolenta]